MSSGKADFVQKAQSFIIKGQWRKALDQMEKAYGLDKSDPSVTIRIGDLHVKLKEDDIAAQYYIKTASLFAVQGQVPKAIATYKMALKTDGTLPGIQEKIDALALSHSAARTQQLNDKAAPRGAIDLSDTGSTTRSGSPADELFGDHIELNENPDDTPGLHTALLSGLSLEELSELMGRMKLKSFDRGATVVREGEDGNSLYIIRNGRVKVVTRIKDEEVVLARLGDGDFFGEVSFLTGRPRTADIVAEEPSELMELCRDDLNSIIEKHPDIESVLRLFHENRVSDTLASLKAISRDFLK